MLVLEQVGKIYPGRRNAPALSDVDLTVADGEFLAVVGPSGSGKSTLMNIIGLLDRPTTGRYWLMGEEVGRWADRRLAKFRNRTIGFVFQSFNLVPTLTARENVELPLIYRGMPPRRRREVADHWLSELGLEHRLDYRPQELSGGQQQRVAVARALAAEPKLLLADEPTGNLDEQSSNDIMRLFQQLHREGQTIVLITHDRQFARVADRAVTIESGRLVSPREGALHANG
ncbi:ABC transporter ATP-binding protein [Sulfobacillus harzensis]|uniref:ABC transporter ATP-binding protein n=1 Tax=Sulfobacillus harzensis TaxID=2729629 RepID=A0A7Y0Q275_9FIRM|nr:ABC transporter ATP-binding protein [Sulfobacillus harzensis]NMP22070.1 ABC transporter ATP-binding protein [Sulfobacillus harzensis]